MRQRRRIDRVEYVLRSPHYIVEDHPMFKKFLSSLTPFGIDHQPLDLIDGLSRFATTVERYSAGSVLDNSALVAEF